MPNAILKNRYHKVCRTIANGFVVILPILSILSAVVVPPW